MLTYSKNRTKIGNMERKTEEKIRIKNIQVPFKSPDERRAFEEFLDRKGLKAGKLVRSLIYKEMELERAQ